MNSLEKIKYWYADLYEKMVLDTEDVNFIIENLGTKSKKILEVACGGGRILVPMLEAGHSVVGFDSDPFVLAHCRAKTQGKKNIQLILGDGLHEGWGHDFDVVVMGGNILLNIVSDLEYAQSQKIFLRKAFDALKNDGMLLLIFDNSNEWPSFSNTSEKVIFEGTDDTGTYGKYTHQSNRFDAQSRVMKTHLQIDLTTSEGEKCQQSERIQKYFPLTDEVVKWLEEIGFKKVEMYGDFNKGPFSSQSTKAIVIANRK